MTLAKLKRLKRPKWSIRKTTTIVMGVVLVLAYALWINEFPRYSISVTPTTSITLPIPDFRPRVAKQDFTAAAETNTQLNFLAQPVLTQYEQTRLDEQRQDAINRVESLFARYGSNLAGYGHILVDQSKACGGDYKVLVGIAGSESGLGRINVLRFNPFGYLNGVQYDNYEQALTILSCKVSQQHISKCGEDLYCLARRYTGPGDDQDLFVSKIAWFMSQI